MASGSTKAIMAALFANLGIAIAKFVGYVVTGSSSMLAETIHSVADTTNQGLLLLGGYKSRKEATREHPFGYGRERYFWAFVVSLVLFTLGGVFAIFEGFRLPLLDPAPEHEPERWPLLVRLWPVYPLLAFLALQLLLTVARKSRPSGGTERDS